MEILLGLKVGVDFDDGFVYTQESNFFMHDAEIRARTLYCNPTASSTGLVGVDAGDKGLPRETGQRGGLKTLRAARARARVAQPSTWSFTSPIACMNA